MIVVPILVFEVPLVAPLMPIYHILKLALVAPMVSPAVPGISCIHFSRTVAVYQPLPVVCLFFGFPCPCRGSGVSSASDCHHDVSPPGMVILSIDTLLIAVSIAPRTDNVAALWDMYVCSRTKAEVTGGAENRARHHRGVHHLIVYDALPISSV